MSNVLSVNNIQSLVDSAKAALKSASVVAMPEAWKVLQLAAAEVIQSIEDNNPNLKGADKKTLAMTMLSNFYDQVFTIISFPFVPKFLQPIIQKSVKSLLMILVSASIDSLVTIFKNSGVFPAANTVVSEVDNNPKVSDK